MKKIYSAILSFIAVSILIVPAVPASLFISDWGITPGVWTPSGAPSSVSWITEDFTGSGAGYVGPGYGGQPFDAEAAYIGFQDSSLYIAIITGMPQQGSPDPWRYGGSGYPTLHKYWYDPGDIGIDIGGDGTYEFAITTRANNLNSPSAQTPGAGYLLSGGLNWIDPFAWSSESSGTAWSGASDPWAVDYDPGDMSLLLGDKFSYSDLGGGHYAIEAILDMSLLGLTDGDIFNMHWVMECGNDNINLSATVPTSVPEPSTMMMLAAGLSGIIYSRKKMKK